MILFFYCLGPEKFSFLYCNKGQYEFNVNSPYMQTYWCLISLCNSIRCQKPMVNILRDVSTCTFCLHYVMCILYSIIILSSLFLSPFLQNFVSLFVIVRYSTAVQIPVSVSIASYFTYIIEAIIFYSYLSSYFSVKFSLCSLESIETVFILVNNAILS